MNESCKSFLIDFQFDERSVARPHTYDLREIKPAQVPGAQRQRQTHELHASFISPREVSETLIGKLAPDEFSIFYAG